LRWNTFGFKTRFGEVGKEYDKFGFDKSLTFKGGADFFAPGHPMLESIVEQLLQKHGRDLENGATFVDPSELYLLRQWPWIRERLSFFSNTSQTLTTTSYFLCPISSLKLGI
jgi:hypothetical protein